MYRRGGRASRANSGGLGATNTGVNVSNSNRRRVELLEAKINTINKGKVFRPSMLPPVFSAQCWNTNIIRLVRNVGTTWDLVSSSALSTAAVKQLGLYTYTQTQNGPTDFKYMTIEFKIINVCAWDKAEAGYFRLLPLDLIQNQSETGTRELANIDCMGQKNMYACGGFVWPSAHQNAVYESGHGGNIVALEANKSSEIEVHIKINWRSADAMKLAKVFEYVPDVKLKRRKKIEETGGLPDEVSLSELQLNSDTD